MRVCCTALFFLIALSAMAQSTASSIIFWEAGFPAADTAPPDRATLAALPNARFANTQELAAALAPGDTKLLVLPYGSAFPEEAWPAIYAYLQRGGNLLTLGGRPFSQAAYRECDAKNVCAWKLRYPRNAWAKALFINDYTETPGPKGLAALGNDDLPEVTAPSLSWKRSWSPTVRMSAEGLYPRIGTAGTIDMRLDTLVWFTDGDGHKLAAPVIELDHIKNNFVGGRWVMVLADLERPLSSADLAGLAHLALQGARVAPVRLNPQKTMGAPRSTRRARNARPTHERAVPARRNSELRSPRESLLQHARRFASRDDRLRRERPADDTIISARHRAVSFHQQRADAGAVATRTPYGHSKVPRRQHADRAVSHRL